MGSWISSTGGSVLAEPCGKPTSAAESQDAPESPPRKRPRHIAAPPVKPVAVGNDAGRANGREASAPETRGLEAPVRAEHKLRTVRDAAGTLTVDTGGVPLYSDAFLNNLVDSATVLAKSAAKPVPDAVPGVRVEGVSRPATGDPVDAEHMREQDGQVNFLSHELRKALRKRQVVLPRADAVLKELAHSPPSLVGALADREVRKVDVRGKLLLAPLTTNGNLPFRRVCKDLGVDITCGEMALADKLLQGQNSEWALMRRHRSEQVFGVQLCGSNEAVLARAAELVSRECSVDFIDINAGCPIDIIYQRGAGCSLMARPNKFAKMVAAMSRVIDVPLSVKVRMGIETSKLNAHDLIPKLAGCGASWVTVHGRTRKQRYSRLADWSYIRGPCAAAARQAGIPLIGNGDIYNWRDVEPCLTGGDFSESGVQAVMLARGALIKPWLATEIKERRDWDISASERLEIYKDYCRYGLDHWGSDRRGVETTRRFLLEFLSFAYRYVPIGLLETGSYPVSMTHRAPILRGRSDLETLFSSHQSADWIRISEMMLGPVPVGFSFQARHKSNAWGSEAALNG